MKDYVGFIIPCVILGAIIPYLLELRRAHNALERYVRQLEQKIEDQKE